jgi:predicted ATPase
MLRRLEAPLRALAHGPRDVPERHQTLRNAIQWSYDLLDVGAQRVFAHLGIFAGGCTLEAAQAVTGSQAVLPTLEALCEASLVQAQAGGDQTRYSLLETLRAYALEQLEARGEAAAARRGHAAYFLALAERAAPALGGPQQKAWLDSLDREHANLLGALDLALCAEDGSGPRLAVALHKFWEIRGYLTEGRAWLTRALAQIPPAARPERAAALEAAGLLAARQGDNAASGAMYEKALVLFQQLEDGPAIARTLRGLGIVADNLGSYPLARSYYQQSLDTARQSGDVRNAALALNALGWLATEQGDFEGARSLYDQSLPLAREAGDMIAIGVTLLNQGLTFDPQTEGEAARALFEESLSALRAIEYKSGIALVLFNLGNLAEEQAQDAAAEAYLHESLGLHRELGDLGMASYPLFGLGRIAYRRGDLARAQELFRESLTLRHAFGENRPIARTLESLALIEQRQGQAERAARLFGAAAALRQALGVPLHRPYVPEYEQAVAALRATLGGTAMEAAWAAGRALPIEQAVTLALQPGGPASGRAREAPA